MASTRVPVLTVIDLVQFGRDRLERGEPAVKARISVGVAVDVRTSPHRLATHVGYRVVK